MLQKTLRNSLWLVLVLALANCIVWSKIPAAEESQVTISVHNDAGIPFGILLEAESEASGVFRQSGIAVRWLNCPLTAASPENARQCAAAEFPRHLQLRIAKRSLNLNEFTMGISYLSADGTGCYADLFYNRAQFIHETSQISLATILGHAMAHELGHLLLGTNSHAPTGLMRARWQTDDLARASKGRLVFSTLESQVMQNKLAAWHAQGREDSLTTAAHLGN